MNRTMLKLLEQRAKLALGSMSLVEKQLLDICTVLDNQLLECYDEPIRGEEEKSDFFISSTPLEVYVDDAD